MKKTIKKIAVLLTICVASLSVLSACGTGGTAPGNASSGQEATEGQDGSISAEAENWEPTAPEIAGLTFKEQKQTDYTEQFAVYKYDGGYAVFDIREEGQFLLVPEGQEVPADLPAGMTVLQQPKHIYLAATALMSLFTSMNGMDVVSMTSLEEDEWTFDAAQEAMESGSVKYAGKYREPDYEMLVSENCDLAIESTMIYHVPEVQEQIENLGIPVLIDRSSYESNPLGRAEWIRLYGVLSGHEEEADAFFAEQEKLIEGLEDFENTELTVAFFYISADGKAVVRASTDYVPMMIEMAGGRYAFADVINDSGRSSIPMSMETFYNIAENADIIIYNSSIDNSVKTLQDLENKDPVIASLKAVQEGNCWSSGNSIYQRPDIAGSMIMDFHNLLTGNIDQLQYLSKLE
ncbi:MAG: ABC transporter substrate-binding protein [Eubacterium sp.]|nr:ABC transporter substrate-binding protein [Eubacterium sp.]